MSAPPSPPPGPGPQGPASPIRPASPISPASPIREEAPAKVNLYLRVTGRRADGYHLLDTLVVFPAIGDTIEVEPADELSLTLAGPFADVIPASEDNLVIRAARALAAAAGCPGRARIRLRKRLPVASGIGGGSADAAAALRALARLWRLDRDAVDLHAVALALGADVPMCLEGRAAFIGGIGEEITPAPPLPDFWLVLANPGVAVPTPAVFAGRRGPFSAPARFAEASADAAALARRLGACDNDLADPARRLAPEIDEVLSALAALPGALLARMSGSGATCFALFADAAEARAAAAILGAERAEWWAVAAPVAGGSRSG